MLLAILCLVILLPLCWLLSEFQDRQWLRILVGVAALSMSYFVAYIVGALTELNYNANYGAASAELIQTVIGSIESGNDAALLRELKQLQKQYHPTYENRASYDQLVQDFVDRMEAPQPETTSAGESSERSP
jgi:glucan phosphoethanolaminetransferase (alkaline phosphatase superfamily)